MGYEIAGGLGVKMAAPDREVYVMVGDGSYLMMAQEIVTAVQEGMQAHDRPARQPRLRQHRRAVEVGRLRRVRHRAIATAREPGELDGDAAAGRLRRQRRVARRAGRFARGTLDALRAALAKRAANADTTVIVIPVDRDAARRRLRILVGCAGGRGFVAGYAFARRARRVRRGARKSSADFLDDPRGQCALFVGRARVRAEGRRPGRRRCSTRSRRPATPAPSWATGDLCQPSRRACGRAGTARALDLVGAFVPVALARIDPLDEAGDVGASAPRAARGQRARRAAVIVLSDDNGANPLRTAKAGRVRAADEPERTPVGRTVAAGAERIARAVCDRRPACGRSSITTAPATSRRRGDRRTDARTRPGCSGCAWTPAMRPTAAARARLLAQHRDRIWHVHFKDCDPRVAAAAREHHGTTTGRRRGVFCELGHGTVTLPPLPTALQRTGYDGWIVVEQDVLPSIGSPADSASRNREFLRRLAI